MNEEDSEQTCNESPPLIRLELGRKWVILTSVYAGIGALSIFLAALIYPYNLFQLITYGGSSLIIAGLMFQVSYPCTYRRYAPIICLLTCLVLIMVAPLFGALSLPQPVLLLSSLMTLLYIAASVLSIYLVVRR
ncbi:MAG: hypothetical protein ACFFD6_07180 [Candidatus Thorarchaeota archaeon]